MNILHYYGNTPIISAACQGHEGIVDIFLNHGPDTNPADKNGGTALAFLHKS